MIASPCRVCVVPIWVSVPIHPRDLTITLTKLPVSKIPILNRAFYLSSYLISLSMAPIRRSNRARKPRVYWDPTITPSHRTRRTQAPAFTIYTEPEDLNTQLSEQLSAQLYEGLIKDLGSKHAEALGFKPDEDLGFEPDEDLGFEPDEDLSTEPDEDLDTKPDKDLDTEPDEDQSYQLQFLSKDRIDKSQNLFEDSDSLKLFQLFFSVKEI